MTSSSHPSQVSSFTVIQLNTRSLIPRADELRLLVSSHPADVIAIQESWLSNNNIAPDLRGYILYGVNRQSAAAGGGASGGGVGFYVRDSLSFCVVPVQNFSGIEVAVISLQAIDGRRIYLTSVYVPPSTKEKELKQLTKLRLSSSILFGDFNAHHPSWSSGIAKSRGKLLHRLFGSHDMKIFGFPGIPTYIGGAGRHSSPDLVAVGPYINAIIEHPQVLCDVGSDHLPIITRVRCRIEKTEDPSVFWRPQTLQLDKYRTYLNKSLNDWKESHNGNEFSPSSAYAEWTTHILEAASIHCRQVNRRKHNNSPSWYRENAAVRKQIQERRRLRRRFQRRRDLVSYRKYQESKRQTDVAIREAKEKDFERHCSTFTMKNMYRRLEGLMPKPALPAVVVSNTGQQLTSDHQIADGLCQFFSQVGSNLPPAPIPNSLPASAGNAECHDPITLEEVLTEIQRLQRNKAAGPDGIFTFMIIDGGLPIARSLRFLFQRCWEEGSYPSSWNTASIKPIRKSPAAVSVSEFRPISLTPVVAKMFESIVRARLTVVSTRERWLPSYQAGVRPRRCAHEHLVQLQLEGHKAFKSKEVFLAAFLDFSKAYDTVSRPLLLHKLRQLGVDGPMLNFLSIFLGRRHSSVQYRSTSSTLQEFTNGVPQGSPLSPFLFTVYIAQALKQADARRCAYADDLALWVTASTLPGAEKQLSSALSTVYRWSQSHRMQFSPSKCCVLQISQGNSSTEPHVQMGPHLLKPVSTARYLGVEFDSALTFKDHIEKLIDRKGRLFDIFQRLTHHRSGVHQQYLLRLYKACLLPKIEFASAIWGDASKTNLKKVAYLQHRGLCRSLGINRLSHSADVCIEARVPPIQVRHQAAVLRLWTQLTQQRGPASRWLASFPKEDLYISPRRSSFLVRLSNISRDCGISIAEAKNLKKPRLLEIQNQLWLKSWKSDHQPSNNSLLDADGKQARYDNYARLHQDITWYKPKAYSSTTRPVVALWHMLRLGTAPLNDFLTKVDCHNNRYCACGTAPETIHHFLLQCTRFRAQRAEMLSQIYKVAPSILINLDPSRLLGDPCKLPNNALDSIFVAVTTFIRSSRPFDDFITQRGEPPG